MLKILIKNMDKKNFLVYGISIILFAVIIFIISFLYYINNMANLRDNSDSVKSIFVLYYIIILVSGFMFVIYALKFYIKSRIKEYSLFVMLGTSKKKVLVYLLVEFFFIFFFATLTAIILGGIVIFPIWIIFYFNGIKIFISIMMLFQSIQLTFIISFVIFLLGCISVFFYLLKKDLSKMRIIDLRREYRYKITCLLAIMGIVILIQSINMHEKITLGEILFRLSASLFAIYLILTYGLSFIINMYIKYFRKLYYRNIFIVNELVYKYKTNKTIMFVTCILNTVIIFFSGGMIITTYQYTEGWGGDMLLIRISSYFMALFTIFCNMGILFLKHLNDTQLKINNYEILKYLGMSEADRKKSIKADFMLLLIIPIIVSDVLVWFYIIAECKRVGLFNLTYVIGFVIAQMVVICIQIGYFCVSSKYLIKRVIR